MAKAQYYTVVRRGGGFTPYGPTPDVTLSRHRSEEAAQRAFDRVLGRAVLLSPEGKVLSSRSV